MPRAQPVPIVSPDLGIIAQYPEHAIPDRAWVDGKNVRFRIGKVQKVGGYTKVQANALTGAVTGLFEFQQPDGDRWWMAGTPTKVYKKQNSDGTWQDITGAIVLTGGANDWHQYAVHKDNLIICNGINSPVKWTGTGNVAALGGSPPIGRVVAVFQNHTVFGNISGAPNRIKWSDIGDPEIWTGGESGQVDFVDDPGGVEALITLRDSLMIYKEDGIYIGDYTGFPFTMQFRRFAANTGAMSRRTVVAVRDAHFFMGFDKQIYKLTLGGLESIGDPVRHKLFAEMNYDVRGTAFAVANMAEQEVWFVIPTASSSFPDTVWIYNYLEGKWGKRELTSRAAALVTPHTTTTWDSLTNSWDSSNLIWDFGQGFPIIIHGDGNGDTFKHVSGEHNANGVAIDGYVDSKWFTFQQDNEALRFKRVSRIGATFAKQGAYNLKVTVFVADWPGQTSPTTYGPFTLLMNGTVPPWVDVDLTGRVFKFRFQTDGSDQPFELWGYEPWVWVMGAR